MGEYAKYGRSEIKIGTCENMYYLRYDQRHMVKAMSGNVDPVRDAKELRFRFPWPDEDGIAPGAFNGDHDRALGFHDVPLPDGGDIDHGTVQFSAYGGGFLVSLPCPESSAGQSAVLRSPTGEFPLKFHRNGYMGAVLLCQQRLWEGRLVCVCRCGGCGERYRLPTLADAQPLIDSCMREVDTARNGVISRRDDGRAARYEEIARRIAAGYDLTL